MLACGGAARAAHGPGVCGRPRRLARAQGLVLEGAAWDAQAGVLCEPGALQAATELPIVHLRPAAARRRPARGTYDCPPAGPDEALLTMPLRDGGAPADHWLLRGAALLLAPSEPGLPCGGPRAPQPA